VRAINFGITPRAAASEWLFEIPIFSSEWPMNKSRLVTLLKGIEAGQLALIVSEYSEGLEKDKPLSVAQAFERLRFFRAIALEQDMLAQLEMGYISKPEEYEPPGDDEA
jgi:hypothetical protein